MLPFISSTLSRGSEISLRALTHFHIPLVCLSASLFGLALPRFKEMRIERKHTTGKVLLTLQAQCDQFTKDLREEASVFKANFTAKFADMDNTFSQLGEVRQLRAQSTADMREKVENHKKSILDMKKRKHAELIKTFEVGPHFPLHIPHFHTVLCIH